MTEQTPEENTEETVQPIVNTIWLTPQVVQRIIEANDILEDIDDDELQEG